MATAHRGHSVVGLLASLGLAVPACNVSNPPTGIDAGMDSGARDAGWARDVYPSDNPAPNMGPLGLDAGDDAALADDAGASSDDTGSAGDGGATG